MSQLPSYTITNTIVNYIVKYELSTREIQSIPLPHKYQLPLYHRLKAEEMQTLGTLIGVPIGYDKAFAIEIGKLSQKPKSKYFIFQNYRSCQEFIKSYQKKQFIPPSTQLIKHLNKLALKNILDDWDIGKFKKFSEKPNEIFDNWYKHSEYHPEVISEKHFDDLMEKIINPKIKVHKLIQICIILFELIEKAPLFAGNQITSILIVSTLLKAFHYNPYNLFPTANIFLTLGSDFTYVFDLAKRRKDLTLFIEAITYALSLEILTLENRVATEFDEKVKQKAKLSAEFNSRQIKILEYLKTNKTIKRRKYSKLMGVSFMTAYRDLNELVEKELLSINGVGRGTYYTLPEKVEDDDALITFVDENA